MAHKLAKFWIVFEGLVKGILIVASSGGILEILVHFGMGLKLVRSLVGKHKANAGVALVTDL